MSLLCFAVRLVCVFFAQQSVEKRPKGLWEGPFFVAWRGPSSNVCPATEGGIPMSRDPVDGLHPSGDYHVGVKRFAGERGARGSSKGAVALDGYGTLSNKQCFGGSR